MSRINLSSVSLSLNSPEDIRDTSAICSLRKKMVDYTSGQGISFSEKERYILVSLLNYALPYNQEVYEYISNAERGMLYRE